MPRRFSQPRSRCASVRGILTTRWPVLGAITISGTGVAVVSVSAAVSNQMKIAVCPAVYDDDLSRPCGPERNVFSQLVVRQRRSDRYRERSLILPLVLGLYGLALLRGTWRHDRLTVASVVLLGLSALASIGFGVFRGRMINLFVRNGELWDQASWRTIGVGWGGLLVTRIALIGIAGVVGARFAASPTSIPVMIAVTLAAQMLVVAERAETFDVPIAPRRRRGRRGRK